jgi:L-gulono-1,4-lactone dehydrogenase
VAMKLLTPSSRPLDLSASSNPELFRAARTGLGGLGIITEVTLKAEPKYNLEEHTSVASVDDAFSDDMLDRVRGSEHVQYFWFPYTDRVQVYERNRTDKAPTRSAYRGSPRKDFLQDAALSATLKLGEAAPWLVPAINQLTSKAFRTTHRIEQSDHVHTLPMPPVYREMEYAIPATEVPQAMRKVKSLVESNRLPVNFPIVVRFTAADDGLLSPSNGRETGYISMMGRDCDEEFRLFNDLMKSLGGRPHWGKEHVASPKELRRMYGANYDAFARLMKDVDPRGVMRNDFLDRRFPTG